jgi:uncharacterized protein (TIGR03083 family)
MSDQPWSPERYTAALESEVSRFLATVSTADPTIDVPTCPGWTMGKLTKHVGLLYRWVDHLVTHQVQDEFWPNQLGAITPRDGVLEWTSASATQMLTTLRAADPEAPLWSWGEDQHVRFWTRRMLFETVIHRADAELALGETKPDVDTTTALDGIDEFLTSVAHASWVTANLKDLAGHGEIIHLHATDAPDASAGEWLITLEGDGYRWTHGHAKGAVAVRAPAADLLLMTYGRIPPTGDAFEVFGDTALLDRWLTKSSL